MARRVSTPRRTTETLDSGGLVASLGTLVGGVISTLARVCFATLAGAREANSRDIADGAALMAHPLARCSATRPRRWQRQSS